PRLAARQLHPHADRAAVRRRSEPRAGGVTSEPAVAGRVAVQRPVRVDVAARDDPVTWGAWQQLEEGVVDHVALSAAGCFRVVDVMALEAVDIAGVRAVGA